MQRAFRLCLNTLRHDTGRHREAPDDQPILVAIGFHGTFWAADSTQVWRLPLAGAAGPESGAIGTFTFPGSAPAARTEVQILGAAVIAAAHDRTPLAVIAAETDAAVTALRDQLAPILRHACPAFWTAGDAEARVTAAIGVVRSAVTFGLLRRLGSFAASIGDPDDQFDAQFLCYSNAGIQGFPGIRALDPGTAEVRFGGPFAGYWIDGRLEAT
ncbi:MAG TPA: hypothetical protein VGM14_16745 [Streptosporangiaceae bacterium]